jgi:flagellar motor switch protein FliN/FliY
MSDDENNETDELKTGPEATATDDYTAAPLKDLTEGSPVASGNNAQMKNEQDINLDVILDVPITISVEIGRTQVAIRDLLRYSQGSVIELDRLVSEPLDVLVNNTLIAHGEVVVVDDQFGIRLTDVISPSERVKKLK